MRRQLVERELTPEGPRRTGEKRGRPRTVTVNLAESPIAWLHSRGHLDDRLFDAGAVSYTHSEPTRHLRSRMPSSA